MVACSDGSRHWSACVCAGMQAQCSAAPWRGAMARRLAALSLHPSWMQRCRAGGFPLFRGCSRSLGRGSGSTHAACCLQVYRLFRRCIDGACAARASARRLARSTEALAGRQCVHATSIFSSRASVRAAASNSIVCMLPAPARAARPCVHQPRSPADPRATSVLSFMRPSSRALALLVSNPRGFRSHAPAAMPIYVRAQRRGFAPRPRFLTRASPRFRSERPCAP